MRARRSAGPHNPLSAIIWSILVVPNSTLLEQSSASGHRQHSDIDPIAHVTPVRSTPCIEHATPKRHAILSTQHNFRPLLPLVSWGNPHRQAAIAYQRAVTRPRHSIALHIRVVSLGGTHSSCAFAYLSASVHTAFCLLHLLARASFPWSADMSRLLPHLLPFPSSLPLVPLFLACCSSPPHCS